MSTKKAGFLIQSSWVSWGRGLRLDDMNKSLSLLNSKNLSRAMPRLSCLAFAVKEIPALCVRFLQPSTGCLWPEPRECTQFTELSTISVMGSSFIFLVQNYSRWVMNAVNGFQCRTPAKHFDLGFQFGNKPSVITDHCRTTVCGDTYWFWPVHVKLFSTTKLSHFLMLGLSWVPCPKVLQWHQNSHQHHG